MANLLVAGPDVDRSLRECTGVVSRNKCVSVRILLRQLTQRYINSGFDSLKLLWCSLNMHFSATFVAQCLLLANLAFARLLTSPEQIDEEYDFIIMGGGTAGNVLAYRLSEIPSIKVLVVEAGISNDGILDIIVPFLCTEAAGTIVDWNYTSTPQPGLNGRSIEIPRGFVLGGSSSISKCALSTSLFTER